MMNMQNMMRQAQKLQKQMEKSQAELAAAQFTGSSLYRTWLLLLLLATRNWFLLTSRLTL